MKKIFLQFILICITINLSAQKMYIWCPEQLNTTQRKEQLKNVQVNIIINDTRVLTDNTKDKCTSEELCISIFQFTVVR